MVGTLYGNSKTRPFPHLIYRYRSRLLTAKPFWPADHLRVCKLLHRSSVDSRNALTSTVTSLIACEPEAPMSRWM